MDITDAARLIEASPDFRLLRRVPTPSAWPLQRASVETRQGVFVDTETTGLDPDIDEVIELALLPFEYERDTGAIVRVDQDAALSAFRSPPSASRQRAAKSTASDDKVAGQVIDPERICALIEPAHIVIAHNAAFDRPMVEKHWPLFEEKHWACSFAEIDWKGEGVGSAKLDYLLWARGWCHDGHRAMSDAEAALYLLTMPLPASGRLGLGALLECARRPLRAVRAEETAFEQRAALKARGYRWDEGKGKRAKAWWIMTDDPDGEIAWLRAEIYRGNRDIPVVNVPPTRRYSARLWPS